MGGRTPKPEFPNNPFASTLWNDVWESREAGQTWMDEQLSPVLERMMAAAPDPSALTPPAAEYWYDLHGPTT